MYDEKWYENPNVVIPLIIVAMVIIVFFACWFSSSREASLYNGKFGTQYTTSDFFWAGDTVKEFINQGKQSTQNININGTIPVKLQD